VQAHAGDKDQAQYMFPYVLQFREKGHAPDMREFKLACYVYARLSRIDTKTSDKQVNVHSKLFKKKMSMPDINTF